MEHEDNCRTGTGNVRHGAGLDQPEGEEAPSGINHSISPDMPCPETVLVARMTDGSYLLVAYPWQEPAAFVGQDDAGPLRQALAEAFGSSTEEAATGNENGKYNTGAVLPEHKAPRTKQAQP